MENAITVSQLNRYIKLKLENDTRLKDVCVSGEISNFIRNKNGHIYFSLKDNAGTVKAVMFSKYVFKLKTDFQNGDKVFVRGSVGVYEEGGVYQIIVTDIVPDGIGDLSLAFDRLREKLFKEGLFDDEHKKPISQFPKSIGIITSPTGAALQDMINVFSRRFPICELLFYPAQVQGDNAAKTLIKGIEYFNNQKKVDTLIIGRGGGSAEDLWCFNDENLARAIYDCQIPIISCVGHQTDFTIADFVSDLRAPTPSAAAELATPDMFEITQKLSQLKSRAEAAALGKVCGFKTVLDNFVKRPCLVSADYYIENRKKKLENLLSRPVLSKPKLLIDTHIQRLDTSKKCLNNSAQKLEMYYGSMISKLAGKLDALSPLKVLSRGYSIVTKEGNLASAKKLKIGDNIALKFHDGEIEAVVKNTEGKE